MSSLTILIIRHGEKPAEKPEETQGGPGLTDVGVEDPHSLTERGWQRAGTWAALFGAGLGGSDLFPSGCGLRRKPQQNTCRQPAPLGNHRASV